MISRLLHGIIAVCFSVAICVGQPVVTCENNGVVSAGDTLTCTTTGRVTWSLTPGSVGSIDPVSGVYSAPPRVDVKHQFGGCQIYPNSSILNTRIDRLPVHPRSAGWIGRFMTTSSPFVKFSQAMPLNIVDHDVNTESQQFQYTPELNGSGWWVPSYPRVRYQQGYFSMESTELPGALPGNDHHLLTINRDTCTTQEIYNRCQNQPVCKPGTAASGARADLTQHEQQVGATDAAGLPIMATTLKADELERARYTGGEVRHAIRFTMSNAAIHSSFLWPAISNAYMRWCTDIDTCAPYGSMFRLKSDFSYTSPSGNPYVPIILNTLKRYGIILGDGSTINMDLAVDDTSRLSPLMLAAMGELYSARINAASFEAVDHTPLRYASGKYTVRPDSADASSDDFVEVVATPVSGGAAGKKLLSLRGVAVGVGRHEEYMIAGSTAQIDAWVQGSSNRGLTYTMTPAIEGASVDASGLITAPTGMSEPSATVVQVASLADPTVFEQIKVFFIPADEQGKVRIATALSTGAEFFQDASGNKWWARTSLNGIPEWLSGYNASIYGGSWPTDQGFPGSNWTDNVLYRWTQSGDKDILHEFHIPNGNYKVTLKMSERNTVSNQKQHLEAQATVIHEAIDVLVCQGGIKGRACDKVMPAIVKDGNLLVNVRGLGATGDERSLLSAILIEPNTDVPRLEISDPVGGTVRYNGIRQLRSIGWGVPHSAVWSILSGPGTVSTTGRYTAPIVPYEGEVQIRATSTDDPTVSGEISLHVGFGTLGIAPAAAAIDRGSALQLTANIDGNIYDRVVWSMAGCGSLSPTGVYQAPSQNGCTAVITATSKDNATRTAVTTITVKEAPVDLKVNAGHTCYINVAGWGRDSINQPPGSFNDNLSGFLQGGSSDYGASIEGASTEEENIYRCYRSVNGAGYFQYDFVRPPGVYRVRLMWADTHAPKYQFPWNMNVIINGTTVLRNFDFLAAAGKAFKAYDRTFETTVADDGKLTIRFQGNRAPTDGLESAGVSGLVISYQRALSSGPALNGTARVTGNANLN